MNNSAPARAHPGSDPSGEAGSPPHAYGAVERTLRFFAATTNLLIAGRRIAVVGGAAHVVRLGQVVARMGAQLVSVSQRPTVVFLTEPTNLVDVIDQATTDGRGAGSGAAPLVIVDAIDEPPSPGALAEWFGLSTIGADDRVRDGVVALTDHFRTVSDGPIFLVTPCANEFSPTTTDGARESQDTRIRRGRARIVWAQHFMPITDQLCADLGDSLVGKTVGVSLVLEPKTANLVLALAKQGAEVAVFCEAESTQDDVAAALTASGISVYASSTNTSDQDTECARAFLQHRFDLLIDDGSSVVRYAHAALPETLDNLLGATEETTSGLRPLRVMAKEGRLRVPVIAVNDARCKTLFDNLYGTGQSCVFAALDLLHDAGSWAEDDVLADKRVVVVGFGYVGRGVASHAAALGASVVITETDPVVALRARFAGFEVRPLSEAVAEADLVISATGIADTITVQALQAMRPGTAVAVAGGVDQEISLRAAAASAIPLTMVGAEDVETGDDVDQPSVRILADGHGINYTAAEGNPIEIMDLSFGVQLGTLRYLLQHGSELQPGVYPVPDEVDQRVAKVALSALDTQIDRVSVRQQEFLTGWLPTRFVSEGLGDDA